jgi:predicted O-linked N-acetylglucosamine transferase (SPINDLY family)
MSTGPADIITSGAAAGDTPHTELAKLDAACAKGTELQLAGRLDLAEQLYRAVLQARPQHAAANYCLGMLKVQSRRPLEGLPHLSAALEASPQTSEYWLGYLEALLAANRIEEAETTLALGRKHGLSGAAVEDYAGRLEARSSERRRAADRRGKEERRLTSLLKRHKFAEAQALARSMTERFPESGLAFKVVGAFLSAERRCEEALGPLETAVRLLPSDAEALVNLATNLVRLNRLDEAEARFKRALELDPGRATAHFRLAMVYGLRNRYAEAEASIRAGMALNSDHVAGDDELTYSSFLFLVSHNAEVGAEELFTWHCRVGDLFEQRFRSSWPHHKNSRDPERRLKIGFVSGDFYHHAVAQFVEPVLASLKHHRDIELHAYYNSTVEDAVTERLRAHFAGWHSIVDLDDQRFARQIAADGIDILIDLSGHSGANRLRVFARKPAPIQVSWIGYPGTTGLRSMDYYLADRHFLPPGEFERHFTEKLVYLSANAPFQPFLTAPELNPLPALDTGALTFASFNRLGKVNPATLDLWCAALSAVVDAKMLVGAIDTDAQETALIEEFRSRGIARERCTFHRRCDMESYLKLHHRVDICLDAFPYTGGTTTIQALWMGVPTLTVAGPTPASRQGAAILGQLELGEFIAADSADLAAKSRYWAAHLPELAAVRAGLRARWQNSPARQPELIADDLARALRRMWQRWCAGLPAESF